jgi:hypothetical protein
MTAVMAAVRLGKRCKAVMVMDLWLYAFQEEI